MILKEAGTEEVYAIYASEDLPRPLGAVRIGGAYRIATGTSQLPINTWSHLASTYDGTTLRLYVNGTQVGSVATTGSIEVSSGVLRIGGNTIWGEYFSGLIDEVRIYNRALSATEIQTDMNTPVGSPERLLGEPISGNASPPESARDSPAVRRGGDALVGGARRRRGRGERLRASASRSWTCRGRRWDWRPER